MNPEQRDLTVGRGERSRRARVIELREAPDLLGDRSYDLSYLRAIHRQIFQDVYDWTGMCGPSASTRGDESFCPPGSIGQPMDQVAARTASIVA